MLNFDKDDIKILEMSKKYIKIKLETDLLFCKFIKFNTLLWII